MALELYIFYIFNFNNYLDTKQTQKHILRYVIFKFKQQS